MRVLSPVYCCFAVPLFKVGIYTILLEQVVVSITSAVLAFAAPSIVAVSIPSFGSYLLGVLCLLVAAVQILGFYGVFKEKPRSFRQFVRLDALFTLAAFVLAMVWIIVSAVRHKTATNKCKSEFTSESTSSSSEGICNIFIWVQLGVMGFLWVFFALVQTYFCSVQRVYSVQQRTDHAKYNSIYSAAGEEIARNSMTWDPRSSVSSDQLVPARPFLNHGRTDSSNSNPSSLRNEIDPEVGSRAYNQVPNPNSGSAMHQHANIGESHQFNSNDSFEQAQYPPGSYGTALYDNNYTANTDHITSPSESYYTQATTPAQGASSHSYYESAPVNATLPSVGYKSTEPYLDNNTYDPQQAYTNAHNQALVTAKLQRQAQKGYDAQI